MSSLNNINNNASVVNVGRTTPVNPGAQPAAKSIPVVVATDQTAIPVVEQNKIQSEVALSLLGIPRSEVALGIFADVNTYDVNPSEWSNEPLEYSELPNTLPQYSGVGGNMGWGIRHLPEESGALVTAPPDETAILTSKRFFRYQPGRVSAATFGIKNSTYQGSVLGSEQRPAIRNPGITKYGIFDKFDGYYWETSDTGEGDQFRVVRRTQSIIRYNPLSFGNQSGQQLEDHALGGKPPATAASTYNQYPTSTKYLTDNKFSLIEKAAINNEAVKCQRDLGYFIEAVGFDITLGTNYGATFQGLAEANSFEYSNAGDDGVVGSLPTEVITAINNSQVEIKALASVDATADGAVDSFYNRLRAIVVDLGTKVDYASTTQAEQIAFLKGVTFTNPTSGGSASRNAAKDRIQANYDYIAEDVIQYVNNTFTPPGGYNENKCKRDVLFALNAIAYDILYGGNSATHDAARFFFYDGFDKSDQSNLGIIAQTVAAYDHLISIIDNIVTNNPVATQANNALSQDTTGTAAATAEATRAQELLGIIRGVINEGDIIDSLPGNRDLPDSSWQTNGSYTAARGAIESNKQAILDAVAPITFSGTDDAKCLRDLEFAIDAYIADLRWGGNGHIITNASTYQTAILADAEREGETHYYFRYLLRDALYQIGETAARDKIANLAAYQIQAVTANGTPGSKYPPQAGPDGTTGPITQAQIAAATYGQRPKLDTIFSIYDKYLGYLVSESLTYDTADFVNIDEGFSYADANTYEQVLKFKCIRDVKYVVSGYASDVQKGGNAATAYNAYKYYSNGQLKVYSQTNAGVVAEIERHKFLHWLITGKQPGEIFSGSQPTFSLTNYTDMYTLFGLTDAQRDKFSDLATIIIENFSNQYQGAIEYGDAGQFGDLIILRDGLIMMHAAVYDPSLLKPKVKTPAKLDISTNTIAMAEGSVIIGQYVNYYGDCPDLESGKTYFVSNVIGPKGNVMQLRDPTEAGFNEFDKNPDDPVIEITATGDGPHFIETPVPFITPNVYANVDPAWTAGARRYDGMFPYLYTDDGQLPAQATSLTAGYIDTAINTSVDPSTLRQQIDDLNYKYKTWVRDHVDPTYYSVYEYRVGRTRFSGDALDGGTRDAVYSDNVLDKKAGEVFRNGDIAAQQTSVWDLDFSKVTMLKVEFSWYGAVGALFLAYVPVDNGEARWVRVHHLRCSNQLKISSLGNATLPITYLVYGGGSEKRFGIANSSRLQNPYGSYSEMLVKYGASYYIDGGDRGTVRLFNHSSDTPTDVFGSRYKLGINNSNVTDPVSPYMEITNLDPDTTGNDAPGVSTFYMGARVITGNSQDQNVKVIWVDEDNNYLYLNKPISEVTTLSVIVDRPTLMYGLKTKSNIVSGDGNDVRNRVQVYPTRLSVGASGNTNAKLTLLKTPLFQNSTSTVGSLSITQEVDLNSRYSIEVDNSGYIRENGQFTYGWFLASLNGSESLINVLGRLEKDNDEYYFYPANIYNGTLVLANGSQFLKEDIYDPSGNTIPSAETTFEKERLSSVEVALRAQTPIPGTGTALASYYVSPGSEEFDLATYFDYNKEYISFPLTDEIATLYIATFSNDNNSASELLSLSASFTWEEQ